MIQVPVGDQNVIKVFKTQPGLQNLTLGALAAINEKAIFIVFEHLG
jgi:hypothetical protein